MHSRTLRKSAHVITRPLSMRMESHCSQLKSLVTGKNVALIFNKGRKDNLGICWPVRLTSVLWKITEQILLEVMWKQKEDKEEITERKHGSTKDQLCLHNLRAFYKVLTVTRDKGSLPNSCLPIPTGTLRWKQVIFIGIHDGRRSTNDH